MVDEAVPQMLPPFMCTHKTALSHTSEVYQGDFVSSMVPTPCASLFLVAWIPSPRGGGACLPFWKFWAPSAESPPPPRGGGSPLVYACELWVFAMCPALRGSTVSYAGVAHFPKHSLEYSLNF